MEFDSSRLVSYLRDSVRDLGKIRGRLYKIQRNPKFQGEPFTLDVSSGLDMVVSSMQSLQRKNRLSTWDVDKVEPYDFQIFHAGYNFCNDVMLYFLFGGNVPEDNLREVVGNIRLRGTDDSSRVIEYVGSVEKKISRYRNRLNDERNVIID
jgi:hypothetical protein